MALGAEIEQRVRARAGQLGFQVGELMREAGLHYKYLENLSELKKGPTAAVLIQLRKALRVSLDWLVEGVGDSPLGDDVPVIRYDEPAQVQIPERDIRVAAGAGQIVHREEVRRTWGLPQTFLYALSLKAEHLEFVEIVGNSMYPMLWPGDLVLVDRRSINPDHRAVYALWDGDATVCKWVERDRSITKGAPGYVLSSENPEIPSYKVRADDARVIGRVVWFGRRL